MQQLLIVADIGFFEIFFLMLAGSRLVGTIIGAWISMAHGLL